MAGAPKQRARLGSKALFSPRFLSKALGFKFGVNIRFKQPVLRIWTDSRSIARGDLFAAIPGDRFDGHNFVLAAAQAGAAGAIISNPQFIGRDKIPSDFPLIRVRNTTQALRKMAAAYRRQLKIPILAVAGSNGKTTTKEWIAFLLSQTYGQKNIFKTLKSNNSILGIALSLLQIRKENIAVIEIGIDEPGWMDQHLQVVQPTHGIITTIAEEHLNRLKNIETIAKEELKLHKFLVRTKGGFAANYDCDWIRNSKKTLNTITYSLQENADIEGLFLPPQILSAFGMEWKNPLPGKHNAQNLLAALATLHLLKPDITTKELRSLAKSCEQFEGEAHRSRLMTLKNQVRLLDDCYNANPDSMEKALQSFSELSHGCIQRVVLGDMLDLGNSTEDAHRRILNRAVVLGFDSIYLLGENFKRAVQSSRAAPHIQVFDRIEDLTRQLKSELEPNDFAFIKGSRGMRLERVIDGIS